MISIIYSQSSCLSTAALIFYTCVWIPFHQLKMSLFNLLDFPRCPADDQPETPLPVARYQDVMMRKDESGCPICLQAELESEELVSQLPKCGHVFHLKCIQKWVERGHFTCPLCRALFFFPSPTSFPDHYCGGGGAN